MKPSLLRTHNANGSQPRQIWLCQTSLLLQLNAHGLELTTTQSLFPTYTAFNIPKSGEPLAPTLHPLYPFTFHPWLGAFFGARSIDLVYIGYGGSTALGTEEGQGLNSPICGT